MSHVKAWHRIESSRSLPARARAVVAWLKATGTEHNRQGMARFGIESQTLFGVSMASMRPLARRLRPDHALAQALWATRVHEARILAALIDDPAAVDAEQMEQWAADFDNWAVCDTVCFQLFDRTSAAPAKVAAWTRRRPEFIRRAGFALIASLAVHDRARSDDDFHRWLRLIERSASDDRQYVKKAINWALRQIGKRNLRLHACALLVANRLASSDQRSASWIGRDAARELQNPAVLARVHGRHRAATL